MLSAKQMDLIREQIRTMEGTLVDGKPIGELATNVVGESDSLLQSTDALMPVLRTALVINWKEVAMVKRYSRFKSEFPKITTLGELKTIMDVEEPVSFCKKYLDINASSAKNPKYLLLKELIEGFLEYKRDNNLPSEITAIRHWAERVDLKKLDADPIGKRHGVGAGVVGNLRITLGMDAVKPDRHVIGVMEKLLKVSIPIHKYDEFASSLGYRKRYLDELLFRYGKAMQISA